MLVLSIISTLCAIVWSVFVVFANGMSDSPSSGFQGKWSIIGAWVLVAILWLGWRVG